MEITEHWHFEDDKLYKDTPVQYSSSVYRRQLVMTKDMFRECYIRWILEGQKDEHGRCNERLQ